MKSGFRLCFMELCGPALARSILPTPYMAGLPDPCWVLVSPAGVPACYFVEHWNLAGLAVFSSAHAAERYGEWLPHEAGLVPRRMHLMEAVAFAKNTGKVLECLVGLDDVRDPVFARLESFFQT